MTTADNPAPRSGKARLDVCESDDGRLFLVASVSAPPGSGIMTNPPHAQELLRMELSLPEAQVIADGIQRSIARLRDRKP